MGKKGSGDTGDGKSLNAGELGPKLLDSIQQVPLENLVHDPANARRHGDRNLDAIMASLKKFGQHRPAVVQQQGMIVRVGNGMLEAAKKLGWKSLACLVVDEDDVSATARAIADNRTGELAEWDEGILIDLLQSLDSEMRLVSGFDPEEFDALMNSITPQAPDGDATSLLGDLKYSVVVSVDSEEHQSELMTRLEEEGYKCQPLIS